MKYFILLFVFMIASCGGGYEAVSKHSVTVSNNTATEDILSYTLYDRSSTGTLVNTSGVVVSTWKRTLVNANTSKILWDPNLEFLTWDNTWVYLDRFENAYTGEKYIQRVNQQTYCRASVCNIDPNPSLQWYVPRQITTSASIDATGTISAPNSVVIKFRHLQTWTVGLVCTTPYYQSVPCIRQNEQWWDDNQTAYQQKIDRDTYYGKNLGIGLIIEDRIPTTATLYLK